MGTADQQFCLRWNNHQSTLVSVFDTLLESGTLVDCTLAAEGQYLKAHKVVLSACSPYFEALLSQHYEKHPIVILKDVKFQELKAMMDYMYRGEVNISQDQLGALLKAAESLQIKGLSDSGGGGTEPSEPKRQKTQTAPPQTSRSPPPSLPRSSGLTIEHKKSQDIAVESPHVREGSASPLPRKRRRARRRSSGGDDTTQLEGHETSNSCEIPSVPSSTASIPSAVTPIAPPPVAAPESQLAEDQAETDMTLCRSLPIADPMPVTMPHENIVSKTEPPTELIEPKTEYIEEPNEASVDLTMDDDDLDEDLDHAKPGPSHGGEGSSRQGLFEQWHMTERSSDEDFLNAQEAAQQAVASGAAGAAGPASHRDPQGLYDDMMERKRKTREKRTRERRAGCQYKNYRPETLQLCLAAIKSGKLSTREAGKKFHIPRSTLHEKLHGNKYYTRKDNMNDPPIFTNEEEAAIVKHIKNINEYEYLFINDIRMAIRDYIQKSGRIVTEFKNNVPGPKWVTAFLERHPSLSFHFSTVNSEIIGIPSSEGFDNNENSESSSSTQLKEQISPKRKEWMCKISVPQITDNNKLSEAANTTQQRGTIIIKEELDIMDDSNILQNEEEVNPTTSLSVVNFESPVAQNNYKIDQERAQKVIIQGSDPLNEFKPLVKTPGQYVAVRFNDEIYPGQIIRCDKKSAVVRTMEKSSLFWKWPLKPHFVIFDWEDVLGSIDPPKIISGKGFYSVAELKGLME